MSAAPISFEIEGVRHGWASMNVRAAEASYRMDGFSYTTNAFDDLTRLGVDVALDALKAEARFDGEPAGWMWEFEQKFEPQRGFSCLFRVLEVDNFYDPASARAEVMVAEVERDQFASALLEAITHLETEMGLDGFEQSWLQSYPVRGVAALRAALATCRRPQPDLGEPVSIVVKRGKSDE